MLRCVRANTPFIDSDLRIEALKSWNSSHFKVFLKTCPPIFAFVKPKEGERD